MRAEPPAPEAYMTHKAEECLVADFANKFIGGGVLGTGCVQEEIHFSEHPGCLLALLCCPAMENSEAIQITGASKHANTEDYSRDFKFVAAIPMDQQTPPSTITAMDATDYIHGHRAATAIDVLRHQLQKQSIDREIHKAMAAFTHPTLTHVATGNWGCGVFGGDPELKLVIQLIASSAAGQSMRYHSFGDQRLNQDAVGELTKAIKKHKHTTTSLYTALLQSAALLTCITPDREDARHIRSNILKALTYELQQNNHCVSSRDRKQYDKMLLVRDEVQKGIKAFTALEKKPEQYQRLTELGVILDNVRTGAEEMTMTKLLHMIAEIDKGEAGEPVDKGWNTAREAILGIIFPYWKKLVPHVPHENEPSTGGAARPYPS